MLVSIIIPNYNNEQYLTQCIDSCIKQDYKDIEVIIVDDCSNDNSIGIIKNFQKKYSNIRLIENDSKMHVATARDIGIRNSSGEWITTLDSDDFFISTDKISSEVNLVTKHQSKEEIIAYSGITMITEDGTRLQVMNSQNTKEGDLFIDILTRACAIPRDFLFSKKLYLESGGYDSSILIYEDWDLKIRLAKRAKFYYTGKAGIAYRRHGKGLSSAKKEEHDKWINFVFEKNSVDLSDKTKLKKKLLKHMNPGKMDLLKNRILNIFR